MRTEQQEVKRKERKEQLDALKNPTRPQIIRQTLQRMVLFTSGVRATSIAQQKKKLPRRVRSLTNVPTDKPYVRKTGSLGSPVPIPVKNLRKLHNERRSEGDIESFQEFAVRNRTASMIPHLSSESVETEKGDSDATRPMQLALSNPIAQFNLDSPLETDNDHEHFRRRKLSSVVSYQSTDRHSSIVSLEGNDQSTASSANNETHQENGRALQKENSVTEGSNRSGSLDLAYCRQSSTESAPNKSSNFKQQSSSHSFERTQSLPQIDANKPRRAFLTRQQSLEISPGNETEVIYNSNQQRYSTTYACDLILITAISFQ